MGVAAGCSSVPQPPAATEIAFAQSPPAQPTPSAPETTAGRSSTATPPPSTETSPDRPTTTSYSATPTPDSTSAAELTTEAPSPTSATVRQTTPPTSAAVRQATPPAATTADHSPLLIGVAVLVLIGAGVAVVQLTRRARASTAAPAPFSEPAAAPITTTTPGQAAPSLAEAVVLIAELGEAMLDSGFDVDSVRAAVADVAAVNGIPRAEIITLPTAMFASAQADGQLATSAVATLGTPLLLHQVDDLNAVVAAARAGWIGPAEVRERVRAIRSSPPPYPPFARVAGNALAAAGLAVLLGGSWPDIGVAAVLGGVVGMLLLLNLPRRFQVLVVLAAAFVVAMGVFLIARAGLPLVLLPSIMAPLVTLLPGAALTTGAVELSTGQMVSGAGRIAAGFMQLILLALGITGAAALVGVPAVVLDPESYPLGALTPWFAVAVFGVGILVNRCARRRSMGWILLVLYVAYGAQVLGDFFFGSVLSAFVGAVAMTPVAVLVSRVSGGPPAVVSFLPAYWLLVPGALGLAGVASLLGGDVSGLITLTTTLTTMVAISVGVLVGYGSLPIGRAAAERRHNPRPPQRPAEEGKGSSEPLR